MKAAIEGINAIWAACSRARIVNVDPLCRVVAPLDRPDLQTEVDSFNRNAVFQSWDMLSGRLLPELGGSPKHLDIIGVNYYWTNQWEWGNSGAVLCDHDPRRYSLRKLIGEVWERYGAEILLTETSHLGDMRSIWVHELSEEAGALLEAGIPLTGVCLYPILGMPEWHIQDEWTHMGLWDLIDDGDKKKRVPYLPMLEALIEAQRLEKHRTLGNYQIKSKAQTS